MPDPHRRQVEDYTNPFLVMAGVTVFIGLFLLWALFGYLASIVSGYALHLLINRLPRRN